MGAALPVVAGTSVGHGVTPRKQPQGEGDAGSSRQEQYAQAQQYCEESREQGARGERKQH